MVYIKRLSWKTGINPSNWTRIDLNNLTPTQKLMLISARIFGTTFGGNLRNGNKVLRAPLKGEKRLIRYQAPLYDIKLLYPWMVSNEKRVYERQNEERRKMRLLMRGIKIGKEKGGAKVSLMSVFEKRGLSTDALAKLESKQVQPIYVLHTQICIQTVLGSFMVVVCRVAQR
eukprot:TRINITY_DN13971_c0_g2_i6.p2 TRINITY_DN13971_c0_g2~~TRINITY_DN13971_c0_g2_i6.p2  ORF type:complete len:172 (+),score=31.90 TRINITY_DN13971_c0_g2_i6:208-723(+)